MGGNVEKVGKNGRQRVDRCTTRPSSGGLVKLRVEPAGRPADTAQQSGLRSQVFLKSAQPMGP